MQNVFTLCVFVFTNKWEIISCHVYQEISEFAVIISVGTERMNKMFKIWMNTFYEYVQKIVRVLITHTNTELYYLKLVYLSVPPSGLFGSMEWIGSVGLFTWIYFQSQKKQRRWERASSTGRLRVRAEPEHLHQTSGSFTQRRCFWSTLEQTEVRTVWES